jgi:hypothetical protein
MMMMMMFAINETEAMLAFVQLIPLIISAASAAYGAIKQGKASRAQKREMAAQKAKVEKWNTENERMFNADYYSDYMQRADTQNVIRQMRDQLDRQTKRDTNTAVITGATPESQAVARNARTQAMSNLFGNLSAMGQQYKDRVREHYLSQKNNLRQMDYQGYLENIDMYNRQMESAGNMTGNALGSMSGTDWASIFGKKTPDLSGISSSVGANIKSPINKSGIYATATSAKTDGVIPGKKKLI